MTRYRVSFVIEAESLKDTLAALEVITRELTVLPPVEVQSLDNTGERMTEDWKLA